MEVELDTFVVVILVKGLTPPLDDYKPGAKLLCTCAGMCGVPGICFQAKLDRVEQYGNGKDVYM